LYTAGGYNYHPNKGWWRQKNGKGSGTEDGIGGDDKSEKGPEQRAGVVRRELVEAKRGHQKSLASLYVC
jgi:hypothetical protein